MKVALGILIVIGVILAYFWLAGPQPATAPAEDFKGPTEAPYTKGPNELPPQ